MIGILAVARARMRPNPGDTSMAMHPWLAAGIVLLAGSGSLAHAQSPPMPTEGIGIDKTLGEGGKIELRRRWFEETRRLREFADAGELRGLAMREQRHFMAQRAPLHLSNEPFWRSVGPSPMNMGSWVMGPVAGRTTALAVRDGDDDTLYLGTAAGGLWKSTNAGTTWQRLSDSLDTPSIGSLFVTAGRTPDQDELWVGTGEAYAGGCAGYFGQGLYYSDNGGASFEPRNGNGANALNLSFINAIARSAIAPQTVLAGGGGQCTGGAQASGGVYRTTDGGLSWTRTLNMGTSMDVRFDPADPEVVYAAVNSRGLYKSENAGETWKNVFATTSGHVRMAIGTSNSAVLYVLTTTTLNRSTDAGASWNVVNASACDGQCSYNLAVDVNPVDPDRVLLGAIRPYQSSNGGSTLNVMTSTWGSAQTVHQDIHNVYYSRTTPNRLWIGSDGGLWRSDDGGATFANLNNGIHSIQFYDIALDVRDPYRVFGGAQDNSSSVRNAGDVWNLTFVSGDGFMNSSQPADGADHGRVVFQSSYPNGGPSIYRSNNFGSSGFSRLATTGTRGSFPWVTPMVSTRGMLFVASQYVYRRGNTAAAYTEVSPALTTSTRTITVLSDPDPAGTAPLRLYAGTSDGILHRTDDALAASPAWIAGTPTDGSRITDIAYERAAPDVVYTTHSAFTTPRLRRSLDAGQTWLAIGDGLPPVPANSVAIDPLDANRIFVGSDVGVYVSRDRGLTFEPMMLGMPPGTVVSDLEVATGPHMLVAGTYGSGAWRFVLDPSIVDDRLFSHGFDPPTP